MSQFNWTYLAPNGGKHNVGIFHGNKTGHVLVYVNSKVTLIDFKVKESKSYSIFIDEELCDITIEKKRVGYAYSFDINREADTPMNLQRREEQRKHLKQGVGFLVGLMLFVSAAIFGFSYLNEDYRSDRNVAAMVSSIAKETSAKIFVENPKEASYNFVANGKVYSSIAQLEKEKILLENGMPLEDGDEFIIKYSSKDPDENEINFNRPTNDQILKYKERAFHKYLKFNPWETEEMAKNIVEIAWDLEQMNGLAKIYFQWHTVEENTKFNSRSYKKMIDSYNFKKKLENKTKSSMM